jgi:hypothetical protein
MRNPAGSPKPGRQYRIEQVIVSTNLAAGFLDRLLLRQIN